VRVEIKNEEPHKLLTNRYIPQPWMIEQQPAKKDTSSMEEKEVSQSSPKLEEKSDNFNPNVPVYT
jgi:hypothetical protein